MKNLYPRLKKAPVDAPVTHRPGIYPNGSPCADTPTGYLVSKNQNSRKWKLLPKLAALLLLLQFFTASIKLSAQAPVVTYPWVSVPAPTDVNLIQNSTVVDANGNIYTAGVRFPTSSSTTATGNFSKITPSGVVTTTWATTGSAAPSPNDLVFDANGNLYSSNGSVDGAGGTSTISKITSSGGITVQWAVLALGARPESIAIDANGNLYTANYGNNTVSKITPAGTVTLAWATLPESSRPTDIIVDMNGNVYVSNSTRVSKITPAGVLTLNWASLGSFSVPQSLVFDSNGNLYTTNRGNNTVSKITPGGVVTQVWATLAQSDGIIDPGAGPDGIAYEPVSNSIFTANQLKKTVSKISVSDSSIIQNWVTGLSGGPVSIVISQGNLYVTDYDGGKIARIGLPPAFEISFNQTQPTCANSTNGGLRAIPSETCATGFQYHWTPSGATTDTISNLAPGTYSVRVVCGTDTVNKSITLTAATVVPAPFTSNQSVCSGATVADLLASPAAGYSIVWYATATGGTPLASSTPLVNATKYYAAQVTPSNCESNSRAVDSVTIGGLLNPRNDTTFCSSSNVNIIFGAAPGPFGGGGNGSTYNWTATQNGTGIAASGTNAISFTANNTTSTVKKDTVFLTSNFTIPLSYGIKDSTYYFADTTGSTYLNANTTSPTPNPDFPLAYSPGGMPGSLTDSISIGFTFNFYGVNRNKLFIGRGGRLQFNRASNFTTFPGAVIEGYNALWDFDAQSKVAYKTSGTAPNRKFIVTYINLKVTAIYAGGNPVTTDPVSGRGIFQIVLNETSNTIEVLHQLIPGASTTSGPIGFITEGIYDVDNGGGIYVPGRNGGSNTLWVKIENENKIFFPIPATTCPTQRDTFAITILPTPKVDSIANMQVCPGSTVAAINFTTPITGGTVGYKWANNNTAIGLAASGFGNIPSFTAAATAQTSTISVRPYMLKSATDTCFGTARTFNIAADLPAAPTTTGNLVVYTGTKTISQLAVTPLADGTLNYFYQATGGTALAGSTIVVDDTTYYVTQTVAGCESNPRKQIKVNRIAADSNVLCSPATVGSLIATPTTGSSAKWYDVPSGGTVLANTAALGVGQDTLYVEEGNPSAQLSLHSYSPTDLSYAINGLTVGENDTIYYGTFGDNAKIIRINPDGSNPTIITSGGPGENIRYLQYESDASGRYILYTTQNTVKRLNLNTGVITTIWTSPVSSIFNLREFSRDVANNKLYVADTEFGRIKLVDLANNTAVTIDSLPNKQFGGSSFPRRPFAVCYVAPNSLYIGDFTNGLVFKKDLTTGIRTDSISYPSITDIRLLSNGKIMLAGGDKVSTINQDLTGRTDIVTSLISGGYAEFNSQGKLVFKDYLTIKKLSSIQSNRVPVTVIVNPKPIVTATIDKVVCNNSTVAAVNFSTTTTGGTVTYAWTNNKTSIGLAATGTGNIASFTAVNNSTGLDTAMVIVTPTITNAGLSCVGVKDTFLIIVNPTANVNTVSNQVVCNGSAVTDINFGTTNTGGTVTYAWTNNTTSIGLAASGTGNIATFNGVNTGTAPVTATIVVTPTFTNGGVSCAGPTKTFMITVNPTVTVNPENDQIVCNGAASTAINFSTPATSGTTTYAWTNDKPANGLAASGTGNIASFTAVNNGTAPDTATIIITPTFANGGTNCVGTKDTIYIVVNPTAKINAITDKVACNGSTVTATMPTSTATGGTVTYAWTNNTTSIGLAASGTGTIPSFTGINTSSTAVTANIIVTPTFTNGGISCVGTNDTFNITINPPPIFAATTDKIACNGATTPAITFSTALTGGTAVYKWTNNNTAIGLAASGTGNVPSFTATNTTTAPIMGSIVVYMEYTNAGLICTSLNDTLNYVINPTAVITPLNDQIVCNTATLAAMNFATTATGGTTTYTWTNDKPGIGLAASGSGNIASFTAVNNTATPDTAMIVVTPTFANGGINCVGTKDTIYIVVNPTANVNAITSQVVCNGSAVTAINFGTTNTGGIVTYAWTNNTTSIGLAASGNGNIATFNGVNTGTAPVVATITVTPTFSNGGVSCTGISKTFTITVNPTAIVNTVANQVVCNGSAVSAVNFGTTATGGTVSFVWTNNTTSIGLAASGNGSIASFNGVNTGTAPVTATITVTPTFTNGGTSCIGTASTFTITINPTAKIVAISDKVECNGNVVAAITPSGTTTGGTVSYTWSNNNISIGLAANGTGTIPGFTATNTTNTAVTATIIVTPTYTNGGVSCVGTNDTFNITINPPPIFAATADKYVCNGASTTPVLFTTALTGGTAVYHWTNNNTAIGLAASGTGNVPTFTAINNTTAPIFGSIVVYMDYINAGLTCTSLKDTFNYVVNPTAVINPSNNQVLCNGGTTNAITFSTTATGGNTTYAWTNDKPGIGLAASGSGNIAAFTATNSSNVPVTATITVTPIFTNGGVSCNGTAQSFTVTVNPTAVVNAVSNQAVCADATNSGVIFNSPVAGTTYSWTNNNPSIGLAASGSGNVPSFVAVNPSPNAIHATITVTPNTPAGCIGQAITYTITVNGKSVAPTSINNPVPIVCANNAFATLSVNGGVLGSGAIWKWYADSLNTVSIGSGATLSNIPVAKTTTYFVRAEGTCNNTAAASVVVQRANLVHHVRQHWSDVLLFDNSSRNFVSWQWYKNGVPVNGATLQQYSEGSPLVGVYHVVATDRNGIQSISCPLTITATSFIGLRISLYPNPVGTGANVTVATSFTASELQGANIIISDIYGTVINQISQVSPSIVIRAPATIGMYVVTLTLQNGMKYSSNLLTK